VGNETFSVGDMVRVVDSATHPEENGWHGTVSGPLETWGCSKIPVYPVRFQHGSERLCSPKCLRKIHPPQDPTYVKWRDALVLEFAMGEPSHV
jgi:hypothetical protein